MDHSTCCISTIETQTVTQSIHNNGLESLFFILIIYIYLYYIYISKCICIYVCIYAVAVYVAILKKIANLHCCLTKACTESSRSRWFTNLQKTSVPQWITARSCKNKRCCERILMHLWILSYLNGWFRLQYTNKLICSLWPSQSSNSPSQVIATGGHPSFKEMGMRIGASQNHTHANHMQPLNITTLFRASQLFSKVVCT